MHTGNSRHQHNEVDAPIRSRGAVSGSVASLLSLRLLTAVHLQMQSASPQNSGTTARGPALPGPASHSEVMARARGQGREPCRAPRAPAALRPITSATPRTPTPTPPPRAGATARLLTCGPRLRGCPVPSSPLQRWRPPRRRVPVTYRALCHSTAPSPNPSSLVLRKKTRSAFTG